MRVLTSIIATLFVFILSTASVAEEPAATYELNIEAQALPAALKSFAEQTDLQVVYFAAVAEGKEAPALEGEFTADAALDRLLANADLDHRSVDEQTYSIAARDIAGQGGDSSAKKTRPAPILMAQNQPARTAANGGTSSEDGAGVITGKVTDARTGANLKGALITLEETGQRARTDDLGRFRIVDVPAGSANIVVSALGYAAASDELVVVSGLSTTIDIELLGGSDVEEIVVFGQRSARALALNQERSAENSTTVVSSDLLGNFEGATLSEVLRRAPGVAFQQSGDTGDGTNIIVRGFAPDLNTVKLNGLELPVGNGRDRSAGLATILADSVDKVTISKSLLPSQDSSGIGGLVEIETKSPLDRPNRYAKFSAESAFSDNGFRDDDIYTGTLSGTFGSANQFGLSAAVQYRERATTRVSNSIGSLDYGEYLPLEIDGSTDVTSLSLIDPRRTFPFEQGADGIYPDSVSTQSLLSDQSNLSATIAGHWRIGDRGSLRLDYVTADESSEFYFRGSSFLALASYELLPVAALGGEQRLALTCCRRISASQSYTYTESEEKTDTLTLRGELFHGPFTFGLLAGSSEGSREVPVLRGAGFFSTTGTSLDPDWIAPGAIDQTEGRLLSIFPRVGQSRFPAPLLNAQGLSVYNDPANYAASNIRTSSQRGENKRDSVEFSVRYDAGTGPLSYVEVGVDFEEAEFRNSNNVPFIDLGNGTTAAELGLTQFDDAALQDIGVTDGLQVFSLSQFQRFVDNYESLVDQTGIRRIEVNASAGRGQSTREKELAPYLQFRLDFGRMELIAGARNSRIEIESTFLTSPRITDEFGNPDEVFEENNRQFVTEKVVQTRLLPRLLFNYRRSDNLIFRASYFQSIARPEVGNLTRGQSIRLDLQPDNGPNDDQPELFVRRGNPDLKSAITDNYDLSVEYYDDALGQIELAFFAKSVKNLLESNQSGGVDTLADVTLPDDPRFRNLPPNVFITGEQPVNNPERAELWGVELAVERQLTFLPGFWSGLGFFGNYTYTDSRKTQPVDWLFSPVLDADGLPVRDANGEIVREDVNFLLADQAFEQDPGSSGTLAITYNREGIDANLSYSFQDRRFSFYDEHGLSIYNEAIDSLNFRAAKLFDTRYGAYQVFVELNDLLRGTSDPSVESGRGGEGATPRFRTSASFFGGRFYRLGFIGSFQ